MPALGESVVEGTVGKWLVAEGEAVTKDQPLVEILTDKADSEVPAPVSGTVRVRFVAEDDVVTVGQALCEIEEGSGAANNADSAAQNSPNESANNEGAKPLASPAVRKLARERTVALETLDGTGPGGRITKSDVERAATRVESGSQSSGRPTQPAEQAPTSPTSRGTLPAPAPSAGGTAKAQSGAFRPPPYVAAPGDEVVPFSRRRRIIADHMIYSKSVAPDVVTFAECDLQATSRLRDAHKKALQAEGIGLNFLAFVAAAVCRSLRAHPTMNARVLDDAFVKLKAINLGIAVDTPDGLIVPVIKNADELTVRGLARAIGEIAERARKGQITPDDLAGKTFTISNPGRMGNLVGGAIISQPNVGILRMGTIKKRVVVVERDGEDLMAIHPVMQMALTYDHRIVDGVEANGFLYNIVEALESADFEI